MACQLTHHVTQTTLDKYMQKHMIVCILIDSSNASILSTVKKQLT